MQCPKCGNKTRFFRKVEAEAAYYPDADDGDKDGEDFYRKLLDIQCGVCGEIIKEK